MKPFVICGVPRSGTTIIARFIGGLPGVRVLHEPLQSIGKANGGMLPIDKIREALSADSDHDYAGIKEPFHAVMGYGRFRNSETLAVLCALGIRFIWVVRDPVATFNSQKSTWGAPFQDVRLFVENWKQYELLRNRREAVHYERFCENPVAEWNRVLPLPIEAKDVRLGPCDDTAFMGCHRAKLSSTVARDDRAQVVTEEEANLIRMACETN